MLPRSLKLPAFAFCALLAFSACETDGSHEVTPFVMPTAEELFQYAKYKESQDVQASIGDYRIAANLGSVPAAKRVAEIYMHGIGGVPVDHALAVPWLERAAEAGDLESRYNLGCEHYAGHGVPQDRALAAKHWRIAAEADYAAAQSNLGALYFVGEGVALDQAEAARWFRRGAELGNEECQLKFALSCKNGYGVERDERLAFRWMHRAAIQGNAIAQLQLAQFCESGFGTKADLVDAAFWYLRAAQQAEAGAATEYRRVEALLREAEARGEAIGQRFLAMVCTEGAEQPVDLESAYAYLERAAKQKDARALLACAVCLANGTGVAENDERALDYCERAAKLGDATAQYELGILLEFVGQRDAASHAKAFRWLEKAAAQGHDAALVHVEIEPIWQSALSGLTSGQRDLGLVFLRNDVLRHDAELARHWLTLAAASDVESAKALGFLYLSGGDTVTLIGRRTLEPNPAAAASLLENVASYGDTEARTRLALLYADRKSGVYDLERAIHWVNLAAVNGDRSAVPVVQAAFDAEQASAAAQWSDEARISDPFPPSPCGFCGGSGLVLQSRGQYINGNYWPDTYSTCLECNGTGALFH